MRSYTLKLFPRTASDYELRCYEENAVTPFAQYPLSAAALNHLITTSEQGYRSAAPSLTRLGRELYRWLEDSTQGCLSQRRTAERHVALHLDGAAGLRHLPWELLHDGQAFLCADSHRLFTPVRRASEFLSHGGPLQNRYLRVLFMAASPRNAQPELDFEAEEGRILDATRSQGVELVVEESGSLAGLQRVIEDYPAGYFDVVHLTGHADVEDDRAFFWLEDDYGYQQKAYADQLARAFAGRFPRLLFLSGCRTGQTPTPGMPSLSEALVQAGAPAVLGWALPVGDQAATHLAETLYHKLAVGDRLDEAVSAARQGLWERRTDYWHQLRLYADPTPLTALVTAPQHPGREKFRIKPATQAFLDPEGRVRVCDRRGFVGRRRLLQSALRILRARPGDDEYRPGLLLHGMGGLGKSSLAARLCDRLAPTHDPWVWYGRIDADEVLRRFTQRLTDNNARALLADGSLGLDQRLERLFSDHLKRPLLLVFDDFEHNAQVAEIAAPGAKRFLPRTRPDGSLILESSAETALRAVLAAIRESGTDSRVIATCRQRLSGLPLADLGLTTFLGAELEKKTQRLAAFAPDSKVAPEPRTRAMELAGGNPRLLEWLDAVLRDSQIDTEALLGRLTNKAAEFREDALLEGLLEQLPSDTLRTLALLTLYELPVPFAAIAALDDLAPGLVERLQRLTNLGLAESFPVAGERPWHFASPLLTPLLAGELNATQRAQALGTAAQTLYRLWWEEQEGFNETQALEIRRLALAARDQPLAARVTDRIATWAVNSHRYREAQRWCEEALVLGEDYPLLHTLARAEKVLGGPQVREHYERALACALEDKDLAPDKSIILAAIQHNLAELVAQQGDIPRALQLWNESLVLKEKIGDVKGKAATLSMMAGVIAQQGDIPRALQLWNESLVLKEKIGDVKGKAATLSMMAGVIAQQGDIPRALQLWNESLVLKEKIGDVKGKAATLSMMAGVIAQQGDIPRALQLWNESLVLLEKIGDVKGKAATLHNMAGVIAQQGDIPRALQLWNESLVLKEKIGDVKGKAATLHNMAGVIAQQGDIPRALQLWNESLVLKEKIGDVQGKAATLSMMAGVIAQQGDIPRALQLWNESLVLKEKIGDVKGKAATLSMMAGVIAQQGDIPRALQLWNESLVLLEKIGDVQDKAATLSMMAGVIAQQGDIPRALQLWNESLVLLEKIGDVQDKAATLHNMAGVIAQQGDIPRALQLWNESLVLKEKIGDVQGKAATLANMAWAAGQEGDGERAIELNRRALAALVQVRAWGDVVRVLGNLSDLVEPPEARACLAQALWLALRIHAPVEDSLNLCGAMLQALGGLEAEAAPLLAGAAAFLVATRGGQHPQQEQLFQHAGALLFACAQARGVGEDDFPHWLEELGLLDAARLLPALVAFLEGEVGDWLFERTWVPRLG